MHDFDTKLLKPKRIESQRGRELCPGARRRCWWVAHHSSAPRVPAKAVCVAQQWKHCQGPKQRSERAYEPARAHGDTGLGRAGRGEGRAGEVDSDIVGVGAADVCTGGIISPPDSMFANGSAAAAGGGGSVAGRSGGALTCRSSNANRSTVSEAAAAAGTAGGGAGSASSSGSAMSNCHDRKRTTVMSCHAPPQGTCTGKFANSTHRQLQRLVARSHASRVRGTRGPSRAKVKPKVRGESREPAGRRSRFGAAAVGFSSDPIELGSSCLFYESYPTGAGRAPAGARRAAHPPA